MTAKYLVEVLADCLPMTTLCDCSAENGSCSYCLNLSMELIQNLYTQGFEIRRRGM